MRYAADKAHNPSSFQGHCHFPSKHTHSQLDSTVVAPAGGTSIGAPLNRVFFDALFILGCEYVFNVRIDAGGCDRCLAWTMEGARTLSQEEQQSNGAAPIDPSPQPLPRPMFSQRVMCVLRVVRALRVQLCSCPSRS